MTARRRRLTIADEVVQALEHLVKVGSWRIITGERITRLILANTEPGYQPASIRAKRLLEQDKLPKVLRSIGLNGRLAANKKFSQAPEDSYTGTKFVPLSDFCLTMFAENSDLPGIEELSFEQQEFCIAGYTSAKALYAVLPGQINHWAYIQYLRRQTKLALGNGKRVSEDLQTSINYKLLTEDMVKRLVQEGMGTTKVIPFSDVAAE